MKHEEKYTKFALAKEMMETPQIIKNFTLKDTDKFADSIKKTGKVFFSGEGSSRIFPAKNIMYYLRKKGSDLNLATEGGRQAAEYNLKDFTVFGASNSGSTKEIICLFDKLKKAGHNNLLGLTAKEGTKLSSYANETYVLSCGWEQAVAATKSVAEQALFYQELFSQIQGDSLSSKFAELSEKVEKALTMDIPSEITDKISKAGTIYFAGRNDGVAEELTLKTNEITRKKSDYLEGTYAVHGIEEVMNPDDVVILIDPFEDELDKIKETLAEGVGLTVIAVSSKPTDFDTIEVDDMGELKNYVYLAAGWNILVEVGINLGIDLDKPERARKVGNEFTG
jgi:glucosamine--fructose-6-phosphate aminotransferase (isomerizing)